MTRCAPCLLAALFVSVGCASDPPGSHWTPPDQTNAVGAGANGNGIPQIHTEGRSFKDPAGNTVILRGVDLIDLQRQNTENNGMTAATLMDLLADSSQGWHARMVRFDISPKSWNADPDAYFNNHLKPAVEHATALGLYVIIDWHYISDITKEIDAATVAFWTYVAPKFATYSNVWYELFNEVDNTFGSSWRDYKYYVQPWVDLVRTHSRDNVILVGGPLWDQNIAEAATNPMHGDNIGYVGHVYPEHPQTMWGGIAVAAAKVPVIITEWGYRADPNDETKPPNPCRGTQADFGDPFKAWVESNGLSWTAWVAHTNWEPAMFYSSWALRVGPNDMGGFVKDWLAERKDSDQPAGAIHPVLDAGADASLD